MQQSTKEIIPIRCLEKSKLKPKPLRNANLKAETKVNYFSEMVTIFLRWPTKFMTVIPLVQCILAHKDTIDMFKRNSLQMLSC